MIRLWSGVQCQGAREIFALSLSAGGACYSELCDNVIDSGGEDGRRMGHSRWHLSRSA